jgi:hypothetical protein
MINATGMMRNHRCWIILNGVGAAGPRPSRNFGLLVNVDNGVHEFEHAGNFATIHPGHFRWQEMQIFGNCGEINRNALGMG